MSLVGSVWDLDGTIVLVLEDVDRWGCATCVTLDDAEGMFEPCEVACWGEMWFTGAAAPNKVGRRLS